MLHFAQLIKESQDRFLGWSGLICALSVILRVGGFSLAHFCQGIGHEFELYKQARPEVSSRPFFLGPCQVNRGGQRIERSVGTPSRC